MTISGTFEAGGGPVTDGEVVRDGEPFAGPAAVRDGRFALDAAGPGLLVGRAFAPVLGAAAGGEALVAEGPWHDVRVEVVTPGGEPHPLRLEAFLDPVRLAGFPDEALPLLRRTSETSERGHFVAPALPEPAATFRLQAGRWRLAASFVNPERGLMQAPDFANYVTERALVDGEPLPGSPWSGFELDVAGDRDVTLELRELADDEL